MFGAQTEIICKCQCKNPALTLFDCGVITDRANRNFLFKSSTHFEISSPLFFFCCCKIHFCFNLPVLRVVILILTSAQLFLLHKVICRLHVSTNK